jgi:hypothetical protein
MMRHPAAPRLPNLRCYAARDPLFATLAVTVDVIHALVMVLWVVCLPLLFWHRWPRATKFYGWFAVIFIIANIFSQWVLGECFLTTIARALWEHASNVPANIDDWFTVRFSDFVFSMTPSHRAVKIATEVLIFATAVGTLHSMRRLRQKPTTE